MYIVIAIIILLNYSMYLYVCIYMCICTHGSHPEAWGFVGAVAAMLPPSIGSGKDAFKVRGAVHKG